MLMDGQINLIVGYIQPAQKLFQVRACQKWHKYFAIKVTPCKSRLTSVAFTDYGMLQSTKSLDVLIKASTFYVSELSRFIYYNSVLL